MSGRLDPAIRARLLSEARTEAAGLPSAVGRQASAALAILRRDGIETLLEALDPKTEALLGASTPHWDEFRRVVGPTVRRLEREVGLDGVAFYLGWLKRLSTLRRSGDSKPRGRPGRSLRRSP